MVEKFPAQGLAQGFLGFRVWVEDFQLYGLD